MTSNDNVRFPPIPRTDMSEEQKRIADSIMQGRESLAGPFNAMLRSPELADPLQQIGAYLRFRAPAAQKLKELAIIMVARFWSAEFEWHVHRKLAEQAGLDPSKIDLILIGRRPENLDAEEAAVYRFVGQLLTVGKVDDAAFDELARFFGEQQVTDYIGIVGYYCAVSFMLNVDKHPPPTAAVPMPRLAMPPFTDALNGPTS